LAFLVIMPFLVIDIDRRHAHDVDGHDDDAANRLRASIQSAVFSC